MTLRWRSIPTFLRALGRVVLNLFRKAPILAPTAEIDRREAICNACPNCFHGQCQICTCAIVAKVCLSSEQCPDDPPRWLRVD